jgi:hypothetical protein
MVNLGAEVMRKNTVTFAGTRSRDDDGIARRAVLAGSVPPRDDPHRAGSRALEKNFDEQSPANGDCPSP